MTVQELNTALGDNVKLYRRLKNMSQAELAGKAGVSRLLLVDCEAGRKMPKALSLLLLAQALGVQVWEFFYTGKVVLMGDEKLQRTAGGKR